jgi:glycine cleavage system H protein
MNIPKELKYSSEHEWARVNGNRVTVGITDFAQSQLGDIVYVELPAVGAKTSKSASFSVVESVKAVSDIYAPVTGTVVEVNQTLTEAPEHVNKDPYGQGWIAVIEMADPADLAGMLDSESYGKLIAEGGH